MLSMSLEHIATVLASEVYVVTDKSSDSFCLAGKEVTQLRANSAAFDSREIHSGGVFIALQGERVDGHDFLDQAQSQGAVVALVDHLVPSSLPQILVSDTQAALAELARVNIAERRELKQPFTVVGITGSVGKTTTKDLLATILGKCDSVVAPVGSYNNNLGLPITALQVDEHTRYFIAEMGASKIGDIAYLTDIVPIDIGVVLKVGVAHLGEFGSVEHIFEAKSELVHGLSEQGVAVLNADDVNVERMTTRTHGHIVWFARNNEHGHNACVTAHDITLDNFGRAEFTLVFPAMLSDPSSSSLPIHNDESYHVHLQLVGEHNVMNALAAATAADVLGVDHALIADTLSHATALSKHRMALSTVSYADVQWELIDDSFNANPDSMKSGIQGLVHWCDHDNDNEIERIAVLGAMLELGDNEEEAHRSIGEYVAQLPIQHLIAVGSTTDTHLMHLAQCLADGAQQAQAHANSDSDYAQQSSELATVTVVDSPQAAHREVVALAQGTSATSVVLLKGSHASGLSALATLWSQAHVDCRSEEAIIRSSSH